MADKDTNVPNKNDFISREDAEQFICEACERPGCPRLWGNDCEIICRLNKIPAADVVEVVRCKDCKWYMESKYTPPIRFCYRLKDSNGNPVGYNFAESDFCSYAERI